MGGNSALRLALGENLFLYTRNDPIKMKDPLGLKECCPQDCPSGIWSFVEAAGEASFFLGYKGGTTTYYCLGNNLKCRYYFHCGSIGLGGSLSAGASGGAVGGDKCHCREDLAGWFYSIESGAQAAWIFGNPCTTGGSLGAGVGLAAEIKGVGCYFTLIGCDRM